MSTNKLKAHETMFVSNACKRAIKLAYADLIVMKKAYLEAKNYWKGPISEIDKEEIRSAAEHYWYWKGSADTIESIISTNQRHMFSQLKEMGLDKKMLYIMYGAQVYADYYDAVAKGLETPLEFKSYREKKLEGDDE